MTRVRTWRLACVSLSVTLLTIGAQECAHAAGTTAGTVVSNSATVDYDVNSINQDDITSAAVTFKVDRKVDLTMVTQEVAAVSVTPGSSGNVLTFQVTNTGNDVFDYDLNATALAGGAAAFGGSDNVDAASTAAYVESGTTGGYQSGEDTATSVDNLAADDSIVVYLVASFNTGLTNNDIGSYHLEATAKDASGSALTEDTDGDDPDAIEDVFADGAGTNDASRDAKHSDQADYKVATAELTVSKASSVVSDPLNGTSSPLAIPGAVIEYTVTISNAAGASTAANIAVTDDLSSETNIVFKTDGYSASNGIKVQAPNLYSGAETELSNASDADEGDFNAGTKIVTVTGIELAAGESATVKFQVAIQ